MSPQLELRGLRRSYGSVVALDDLSFDVPAGEVMGFLGPNGAGKTTTMRAVFGLTDLDAGSVTWGGVPVDQPARRRFGYMPEERGLYPGMLVGEQLEYLGRLHGLGPRRATAATGEWLERLEVADRRASKVETLSHGNQQRVQLAAALVHEPELLVLDEPLGGLNPAESELLAKSIKRLHQGGRFGRLHSEGPAVLMIEHKLKELMSIADRVIVMDHGEVLADGPPGEIVKNPKVVEAYLGSSHAAP